MVLVKTQTSNNYHDYLIESLQDIEEVAGYIEVVLEEGSDDPKLLLKVLQNIKEVYEKNHQFPTQTNKIYDQLMTILKEDNCAEIYTFIELLNALGLQININVK